MWVLYPRCYHNSDPYSSPTLTLIFRAQCVEVCCPMTKEFYAEYIRCGTSQHSRTQKLLYLLNPRKFRVCEYLVKYHIARGDKIIIFRYTYYVNCYYYIHVYYVRTYYTLIWYTYKYYTYILSVYSYNTSTVHTLLLRLFLINYYYYILSYTCSDDLPALYLYCTLLKEVREVPYICGETKEEDRRKYLTAFKTHPEMNCIGLSAVGDTALDIPGRLMGGQNYDPFCYVQIYLYMLTVVYVSLITT